MTTSELGEQAAAARAALADGRVHEALTCYASANRAARPSLPPHAPERIALAAEHARVMFDHRSDPGVGAGDRVGRLRRGRGRHRRRGRARGGGPRARAATRPDDVLGLPHGGLTARHRPGELTSARVRKTAVYPAAPRLDVVDVLHGQRVADPYRWLEDPADDRTRRLVARAGRAGPRPPRRAARPRRGWPPACTPCSTRARWRRRSGGRGAGSATRREPGQEHAVVLVAELVRRRAGADRPDGASTPPGRTTLDAWLPDLRGQAAGLPGLRGRRRAVGAARPRRRHRPRRSSRRSTAAATRRWRGCPAGPEFVYVRMVAAGRGAAGRAGVPPPRVAPPRRHPDRARTG